MFYLTEHMPKMPPHPRAEEGSSFGSSREELVALVALLKSGVLPWLRLSPLLEAVGSAAALIERIWEADPSGGQGELLTDALSGETIDWARNEVDRWFTQDFHPVTILSEQYPDRLREVYDRPPMLFFVGHALEVLRGPAIAVVGTRSATPDGVKRAFKVAHLLAREGVTVVSGMALGIDSAAHEGALRAGGPTVAVMGTGVEKRYPKQNAELAERILAAGGGLVSQFFPGQGPTKWGFPARNRTMSGLSLATIVIEAGPTSGARMQAEAALAHGRPVFLPQSLVTNHAWAHDMVTDGRDGIFPTVVDSPEEVLGLLIGAEQEAPAELL